MGTLLAGRYELGDSIGRGGMAEVFAANDQRLERTVAVKVLLPDSAHDASFEERFRREAKVAAALNHPAIVGIYDTGEDAPDGHRMSYIVMEHVAGRTVRELLADGPMSVDQALEIVVGVLSALEYSHRAGIVHRDIKPANVMVTPNGGVKVMDFGIARALDGAVVGLTQSWSVVGTAQYMSPEQARGEPVDARSDLYSVGCLLFELLTGQPPFVAESMVAVAYKQIAELPPPPSALNPALPPVLDQIVARALAKDRDARYQTAAELRADLEAVRRGAPVAPVPVPVAAAYPTSPPAPYPTSPPVAYPTAPPAAYGAEPLTAPQPMPAGTAMLPATGQAPVGYGYPAAPAPPHGYLDPSTGLQAAGYPAVAPPRSLGWLIATEAVVAVVALAGIVYFLLA